MECFLVAPTRQEALPMAHPRRTNPILVPNDLVPVAPSPFSARPLGFLVLQEEETRTRLRAI